MNIRRWKTLIADKNNVRSMAMVEVEVVDARDYNAEVAQLRAWVTDLQSGMYVNCVYCGHRYGPGETTPVSMADALKAHVETCPEHPMSRLKLENEALREATATVKDGLSPAVCKAMVRFWQQLADNGGLSSIRGTTP